MIKVDVVMSEDIFIICAYYYSLPEFPDNCAIVKDNSLFVRDILVSNPANPHIKLGGQYDPHYEHDVAPQYKMCSRNTRGKIMSIVNDGTYDKIYLLFRTTRVLLSKANTYYISGYYDINIDEVTIDPDYEEPVLYAKEARFTDLRGAIDISDFLMKSRNYRFPFSSETNNGVFRDELNSWKEKIESTQNFLTNYIDLTKKLNGIFKYHEFDNEIYTLCDDCADIDKCPLIRRVHKKGKLYHQLTEDIAHRINDYYKRVIKISS